DAILHACQQWTSGEVASLWATFLASTKTPSTTPFSASRRALSFAREGQFSRACRALSSQGLHPSTPHVLDILRDKHPAGPSVSIPPSLPPAVTFSSESVLGQLRRFATLSAPGPSALRVEHLLEAINCGSPNLGARVLTVVTQMVNLLVSGSLSASLMSFICAATLIPLRKKDPGVRPIAIGDVFRRLVSKCLCFHFRSDMREFLAPHQLGVAYPRGVESVVHSARHLIAEHGHSSTKVMLKVDFRNAFNMVSREVFLEETRTHFPGLSAWVHACYGSPTPLYCGTSGILSSSGVQQGDPLGPFLFTLVLDRLLARIRPEFLPISWRAA
ncbi:MAG: reverse transcriptase domain-containing protein, partial [Bacteroidota bacterium]